MVSVKNYAERKKIFLKGDIPFLVSRDSSDVWAHRSLFKLSHSAGAPPDAYAAEGQNWGLPLYNWENMEKDNYSWWKNRLQIAEQYYHIYRIDHIVGFFRIWTISKGQKSSNGSFEPKDPKAWIPNGEKYLKKITESSNMLPIGEDLGDVPSEVRSSLQRIGIAGTKVMMWEPNNPTEYNTDSMTTLSTHDSQTLSQWWNSKPPNAKTICKYINSVYTDTLSTELRQSFLYSSHHSSSLFHINLLPEYLALVPSLIHEDNNLERINIPGTVANSNWSYRLVPTIQQIAQNKELKLRLESILK